MATAKPAKKCFTLAVPPDLYARLKTAAIERDTRVSALIYGPIAERFGAPSREALPEPLPPQEARTWTNASWFCEPDLYQIACIEAERQHGQDGKRSVAGRVLAALVAQSLENKISA